MVGQGRARGDAAARACPLRAPVAGSGPMRTLAFPPRGLRAAVSLLALPLAAAAAEYRVTVPAADADRAVQVVRFALPKELKPPVVATQGDRRISVQVAADRTAVFIVDRQPAGRALTFGIEPGPAAPAAGVQVAAVPGQLRISVGGTEAVTYRMDKEDLPRPDIKPEYKRAGYIHPVRTAAGTVVSDDYPVQHVHHHGIWTAWVRTAFQGRAPDFWNMAQKLGTSEFVGLDWTWSGPVHGGFVARHRMLDLSAPAPVPVLNETWEVTAYAVPAVAGAPALRVFDVLLTQICATNDPLVLPVYHYGGLGFRGRGEWFGADKGFFLTSEGETDRVKANGKSMRWVHHYGAVEGGVAGVTVLGHPGNPRAPQPVRVHPREPYVSFTPQQNEEFRIAPGQPYIARYRFVAFDGPPDRALLDALWQGFAAPGSLTMETK